MLPGGQQICLLTKTYRIIKNYFKSILMTCDIFFYHSNSGVAQVYQQTLHVNFKNT
jgi:hypothetical protein